MEWIMIGFILIALFFSIVYLTYRICFHSPQKGQNDYYRIPNGEQYQPHRQTYLSMIARLDAEPYEAVTIRSRDGLLLAGKYYERYANAPLAICFHGYRSTAIRDFCGGAFTMIEELRCNVLLVDQRAHGKSEGHTITFGIKERFDCLDWIHYANNRFGEKQSIYLYGVSMGASTVLMASGEDLSKNVKGIVADSPYSSPKKIIQKVCRDLKLPAGVVWPVISLGARLFGRVNLTKISAAQQVGKSIVPICVIHGEDDRFVPCDMSEEIERANSAVVRLTFPNAGHVLSYMEDYPKYLSLIKTLMAEEKEPNIK